jgi:hypothetical protein
MRSMIAAALLIIGLWFATPATAMTADEARDLVADQGCTADVVVMESDDGLPNAFYSAMYHLVILTPEMMELPDPWVRAIILHESAHCLQFTQAGDLLFPVTEYPLEWDADTYMVKRGADYGWDTATSFEEALQWIYDTYGFEGRADDSHGTFVDRMQHLELNRWLPRRIEA